MSEVPEMSHTGSTTYTFTYPDFAALREAVEATWEELNHIVEWTFFDRDDLDPECSDTQQFDLGMLMPNRDYTSATHSTRVFDPAEVESWLETYVRPRVQRWYEQVAAQWWKVTP